VLVLLDESGVSAPHLLDLAAGACVEWVHLLLSPRTSAALLKHRPVMWLFRTTVLVGPVAIGIAVCRAMAIVVLHLAQAKPSLAMGMGIVGIVFMPFEIFGMVRLQRNTPIGDTPPRHAVSRVELWRWLVIFLIGGVGQNVMQLQTFSGRFAGGWYWREFSLMFAFPFLNFMALVPHVVAPWFRRVAGRHLFASRRAPNVPAGPLGLHD
jgi:hypothetical protein